MKTKLLALSMALAGWTTTQAQVLNDFEAGSPAVTAAYGAEFSTIANPNPTGNTTANVGQIKRTTDAWYELIRFNAAFSVPANTTKYVHMLARYTSATIPNMSIRVDANGNDGSVDIHPLNTYNTPGEWMDMVFKVDGGESGINPTEILFFADASVNVLNSTDSFAQIDEFVLNDSDAPIGYVPQDMMLNDFEAGSPEVMAYYGAEFAIVANPLTTGNSSPNVGEIKRTSDAWYELIRFAKFFNVPTNTTRYIHVLVKYTSTNVPNISIRVDGGAEGNDGSTDIHPTMDYTAVGQWQDMVFAIPGGENGVTVTHILFFADASVNTLNNTDSFAYIDQMQINDIAEPVAATNTFERNTLTVYPNPTAAYWNFEGTGNNPVAVEITDITGKTVLASNTAAVNATGLANGVYFAKITSGATIQTIKVIKN
jgi:Secretion system C-terminal sorting domain